MYVCICNAICQNQLRQAAGQCDGDAEAVYAALGRVPQCRQCLDEAEAFLAEVRSEERMAMLLSELV
jgi:bacterioferritin-associated ferredoxin